MVHSQASPLCNLPIPASCGIFATPTDYTIQQLHDCTMNLQPHARIDVADVLRGVAVMGIVILHTVEHFNYYSYPDTAGQSAWLRFTDRALWDGLFFTFGGKAYAVFALPVHLHAHVGQQTDEVVHVQDVGQVADGDGVGSEQGGAKHLQGFVLRALGGDGAGELAASFDDE